jgi:hypothetical protein
MHLLEFTELIFKMDFYDEPDYNALRFYLVKSLLDVDKVPVQRFDWEPQRLEDQRHRMQSRMQEIEEDMKQ